MKARKAASVAETPGQAGELSLGEEIGKQGTLNEKPVTSTKPGEQIPVVKKTTQPGQGKPEVKPSARGRYVGNKPVKPLRPPNKSRHVFNEIGDQSIPKADNSVVEPGIDIQADIDAINSGKAIRNGDDFNVNQRRYRAKPDGGLFPIDGNGVHKLSRGGYKALKLFKQYGDTVELQRCLKQYNITDANVAEARKVWNICMERRIVK